MEESHKANKEKKHTCTKIKKSKTQIAKKGGAKIENYEIFNEIGLGAFGLVKLGRDKKTQKYVAIKCVNIMKIC